MAPPQSLGGMTSRAASATGQELPITQQAGVSAWQSVVQWIEVPAGFEHSGARGQRADFGSYFRTLSHAAKIPREQL